MPGVNHRRSRVAHKSTGGTFQSVPEPVDPVGNLRNLSQELTFMRVAPRFFRMLLSTSLAHREAVYKRAGVHTISLENFGFSEEMSQTAACPRLSRRFCGRSGAPPDQPSTRRQR
jgi:hypothetical protein